MGSGWLRGDSSGVRVAFRNLSGDFEVRGITQPENTGGSK